MFLCTKELKREAGVIPAQVRCCEYRAHSKIPLGNWEGGVLRRRMSQNTCLSSFMRLHGTGARVAEGTRGGRRNFFWACYSAIHAIR